MEKAELFKFLNGILYYKIRQYSYCGSVVEPTIIGFKPKKEKEYYREMDKNLLQDELAQSLYCEFIYRLPIKEESKGD